MCVCIYKYKYTDKYMYVCVYIYMRICLGGICMYDVHTHSICIHTHIHRYIHPSMHAYMHAWMYVCMCVCMYMYVCMYVCMHACMYVCVYVCIPIHVLHMYIRGALRQQTRKTPIQLQSSRKPKDPEYLYGILTYPNHTSNLNPQSCSLLP